ncbi:MAG: AAA family ATPase [Synergistaceae bacterium]|jgi:hypothetical protein|nr:AAA family ATPase [Synergistaceae bacterium]
MKYRSNITVASNIYVRTNDDVRLDENFVHNCRSGVALRKLDESLYGSWKSISLTEVQRREIEEDKGCMKALDGQMTHGPVRRGNTIVWECRCEYEQCEDFKSCMPNPIVREYSDLPSDEALRNDETLRYEWLDSIEKIFEMPEMAEIEGEAERETIPIEYSEAHFAVSGEYVRLEEPDAIIRAGVNSHILVNAGPGTGKTYTVVERLAHIIDSGSFDLSQVLVLCYTNAARDVILQRLDAKGMSAEVRQLVICTLDSLAWNNLSQKTDDDLFGLGYDGCIQRFNAEFDAEEWSDFEYVIVDELQDLVNERARMTLNILAALKCGYLLLGDKCQAIYDYDCAGADKVNSVGFYERLESLLPQDAVKYELIGNRRQSDELSRRSDNLREALLTFGIPEANEFFKHEIEKMSGKPFKTDNFEGLSAIGTTAILTRSNGEAEWISAKLHKKNIPHALLRSVNPRVSLHRWVADMFWDYREPRISRDDYIERHIVRTGGDERSALDSYNGILSTLAGNTGADFFDVQRLAGALRYGQDISPFMLNLPPSSLTVSTIHKAKGREFDHVYLLGGFSPASDNTEEARVWYVGATRPRNGLDCLKHGRWALRRPPTARWILQGVSRWSRAAFCSRIVVGLPGDTECRGFILGSLSEAVRRQAYIANHIKVNDPVELRLIDGVYGIFHDNNRIGELSDAARSSFLTSIKRFFKWSDIPPRLTDIYIGNIITVVPQTFPSEADAMFKESNFWLGVELTGFAKAEWHKGEK